MKYYKYEAINDHGSRCEGMVRADSFEEVVLKLMQAKKYPSRVEELTNASYATFNRIEKLKKIKKKLEPPVSEPQPELQPQQRPRRKFIVMWIIFILLWVAVMVIYALQ